VAVEKAGVDVVETANMAVIISTQYIRKVLGCVPWSRVCHGFIVLTQVCSSVFIFVIQDVNLETDLFFGSGPSAHMDEVSVACLTESVIKLHQNFATKRLMLPINFSCRALKEQSPVAECATSLPSN